MHALPIIEREWPSLAADLRDGVSVDDVRERAAETFDGEEYGRLCALLEVYVAERSAGNVLAAIAAGVPREDMWDSAADFMEHVAETLDIYGVARPAHYPA